MLKAVADVNSIYVDLSAAVTELLVLCKVENNITDNYQFSLFH